MSADARTGFHALLGCPQCGAAGLRADAAGFTCDGCRAQFPLVGGLPWLLVEPQVRLGEWRQRGHFMLRELEQQAALALQGAERPEVLPPTRVRLEHLAAASRRQSALLAELLEPLDLQGALARYETHLALRTRTPASQDLHSYYANVHRDWVWGAAENQASFELVVKLAAGQPLGRLLVPGAGAARLAYDVHERLRPDLTVALDINPLLVEVARRVTSGIDVELYEFPIAPRNAFDTAILRRLTGMPVPARAGLYLAYGDALRPPLRPAAVDTVLTPWFVDIVTQDFTRVAAQMNRLLQPGGRWLNFGSLAFAQSDLALRHGPEEVVAILAAQGFAVPTVIEVDLPYMRSPASRHGRTERVYAFAATKQSDVALPWADADPLPPWLADPVLPVPALPYFQTQALANRIYAFVMALIDGQRGIGAIAQYLVQQKLMAPAEAEQAVRAFLTQLYEESRRRAQF